MFHCCCGWKDFLSERSSCESITLGEALIVQLLKSARGRKVMCKKLEKIRAVDLEAYGSKNPERKTIEAKSAGKVYKR